MNLLSWIILGLIAGVIANVIDRRRATQGGILGSAILGIVGAIVGGYLGTLLFGVGISGFDFSSLIIAVLGALLVLFIGRSLIRT